MLTTQDFVDVRKSLITEILGVCFVDELLELGGGYFFKKYLESTATLSIYLN